MYIANAGQQIVELHRIANAVQVKPRQISNSGQMETSVPGATKTKEASKGNTPSGGGYSHEYSSGKV